MRDWKYNGKVITTYRLEVGNDGANIVCMAKTYVDLNFYCITPRALRKTIRFRSVMRTDGDNHIVYVGYVNTDVSIYAAKRYAEREFDNYERQ